MHTPQGEGSYHPNLIKGSTVETWLASMDGTCFFFACCCGVTCGMCFPLLPQCFHGIGTNAESHPEVAASV